MSYLIALVPFVVLAPFALAAIVAALRERAFWRRAAILAFTQHPIANLTPPTVPELAQHEGAAA